MKLKERKVIHFLQFSIEVLLLYLIILPLYIIHGEYLPLTSAVLMILAVVTYILVLFKTKNKKLGMLCIPLVSIIAILFGVHYLLAFLIVAYIFWRVLSVVEETNEPWNIFLSTFVIGLLYFLHFFTLENRDVFILIIVIQFLLVVSIKLFQFTLESKEADRKTSDGVKWQIGVLVLLGGVAALGWLLFPVLNIVLSYIIRAIVYLFYLIAYPFFYLLSFYDPKMIEREGEAGSSELVDPLEEIREFPIFDLASIIGNIFLAIVGIGLVVWIISIIVKKKLRPILQDGSSTLVIDTINTQGNNQPKPFWRRKKPKNEIRRMLFDLDRNLAKKGMGRKPGQTIEEWFRPIDADQDIKKIITSTYQKVRYGHNEISKEQVKEYRLAIKKLQQQVIKEKA
ncbi:DUF4129 domain-containing protein [Alkalihalobacterium chitinilyticum]|uniref:DUF4129 domain-containing protein n=1 Tax=Alkalihalobacterium chitinilyticum TaxID=2980103 RepID=A0ABT5VLE4_9BACI|nr:DUF4129 domain-containing protein [Alkalihalobacterium chitinilyticum]MDE5416254.1 DUF4129 domain-containing protein [Alkalihalobacterium chitinilyticum]